MQNILSERDELLSLASDIGKELFGMRPRWIGNFTDDELRQSIERWSEEIREDIAREAREEREHREAVARAMQRTEFSLGQAFAIAGL